MQHVFQALDEPIEDLGQSEQKQRLQWLLLSQARPIQCQELADAQRQRLREADKVLGMEQLISELQVHRLEGGLWEDWLKRARHILEGE
eukprot:g28335.t1